MLWKHDLNPAGNAQDASSTNIYWTPSMCQAEGLQRWIRSTGVPAPERRPTLIPLPDAITVPGIQQLKQQIFLEQSFPFIDFLNKFNLLDSPPPKKKNWEVRDEVKGKRAVLKQIRATDKDVTIIHLRF